MAKTTLSYDTQTVSGTFPACCVVDTGSDRETRLLQEYRFATDQTSTVSILGLDGVFTYVNGEHCKASRYSREEMIGRHYRDLMHPDMFGEKLDAILYSLEVEKIPWKGMIKNRNKDGETYWLKTQIIPVLDRQGNALEYISIGNDVTDRYLREEDLRKSLAKLQELDEKKDEFINIASHELRTPMTAISGYISMILEGDAGEISDESRIYLEQVFKSSKQLLTLINDMLDIAKLESGKGKLFYEDIEIGAFIRDVVADLKPLTLHKKQDIRIVIDYDGLFYRTDARKFRQVLVNVIGNAFKYTPEGGSVLVRSWSDREHLSIEVADTGIGIPKKHLTHIFEKFSQVKNPLTRDINGTGLGLAITKTIVEKFFGTISVESEE